MTTKNSHFYRCLLFLLVFIVLLNSDAFADALSRGNICNINKSGVNAPILTFDTIWRYFVSILGPGVALFAVLITRPLLKKKLIETHVTQKIEQIHNSNSNVRLYCQKLISKYTPLAHKIKPLKHQDIINLTNDITEGYLVTQDSSSEVATLMYYLKDTMQQYERRFNYYQKTFHVYTSDILPFVVNVLNRVVMYSTQVIPVPVKTRISNKDLIVKPLRRFVTDGKMAELKNFRLGVNYDEDSATCLIYTDMVNRTNMQFLKECAYLVTNSTRSIAKLFYYRNMYAPLIWRSKKHPKNSFFEIKLTLVGFDENTNYMMDSEESNETVVLYYSNLTSLSHKPETEETSFVNDFSDSWLNTDSIKFPKPIKFAYIAEEMIKVEVEREALHEIFKLNKKGIKNNLSIKNK